MSPKVSGGVMLAWPRRFIESVSWMCDLLLADENRGEIMFMPLTSSYNEKVDMKRHGTKEVLELFLSYDSEDDIFVRMMAWGTLILMLGIWWVKNFDRIEAIL